MANKKIKINRAPVLTLWAAVVAERLGYNKDEALTLGKAVAGLNAQSKGRRLGIYEEKKNEEKEKEEKKQERKENAKEGKSFDDMLAYLDENGNLSNKPPDPRKKINIKLEDIEIGVPKQLPVNPEDLIRKGIVTFFNDAKGYGFIKDLETQESVFVHINSLTEEIKEHNKVTFEVEMGPKGANAVRVKLVK